MIKFIIDHYEYFLLPAIGLYILISMVSGWIIGESIKSPKDKYVTNLIIDADIRRQENNYLSIEKGTYITTLKFPFIYKYVIDGLGPIPIWYASHKYIRKRVKACPRKEKLERYRKAFGKYPTK